LYTILGIAFFPKITVAAADYGFISTYETAIVDSQGQAVLLRGVNYPGYEKNRPELHTSAAYRDLAAFGFNVVRLPISWTNLEPSPDVFNLTYVTEYLAQDIAWAKSAGIYVVLDMHQYLWASRFGGNGAPEWTVQNYAPNTTGMRQAVSDFWSNTTLQNHLIQVWVKLAQHFVNEPAIAGYDLLNEPWIYSSTEPIRYTTAVNTFYSRAVQAIRGVDQNHIIFLEPANINSAELPTRKNIVWSPHFYPLSFNPSYYPQNFTILENDFLAKYKMFQLEPNVPMWIGEFGAFMRDDSSRATWLQDALTLFNRYQVGWAWWTYNGSYASIPDQLYV